MTDLSTALVAIATLLVLTGGVAVGFGANGPTGGANDFAAQETTTQAEETNQTTEADQTEETTETDQTAETTQTNETAQTNETTQADGAQGATNVTARNVTVERLILRNVTIQDARLRQLTVLNATGGDGNATNETYRNVSVQQLRATGNATDVTLTNVTLRSESLADALINETGRQRIGTRLVMDLAVLQNQTVNGVTIENATVPGSVAENVSVAADGTDANATDGEAQADGEPEMSAESATVEGLDVSNLELTGDSARDRAEDQTTTTAATTPAGDQTTTPAGDQTTTETTAAVNVTTTTTPAEAGSENVTDENETTTPAE
jgi:hypothetical protein